MVFNAVFLTVGGDDTNIFRPDRTAITFNDNIDLLNPKAGNRESGFHFALRGKYDSVGAVILGAVDDRVEARKSRCQILRTGYSFKLPSCPVCKITHFLFAVYGSPVDVQQKAVNRDAFFLRDLQRFLSGCRRTLCQDLNRFVRSKVGHAVCEQHDHARKPI